MTRSGDVMVSMLGQVSKFSERVRVLEISSETSVEAVHTIDFARGLVAMPDFHPLTWRTEEGADGKQVDDPHSLCGIHDERHSEDSTS